jgi:nucleotide-binding universal stress UspA family protein
VTIKDILVGLAVRDEADPARDYAFAIARRYGAHVTAMAYSIGPHIPFSVYPEFVSNLAQQAQAEAERAVGAAGERFEKAAQSTGVAHTFHRTSGSAQPAASDFSFRLRTADLGVLTQHQTEDPERYGDVFFEAALFQSGRPVIVVPRGYDRDFSVDRVLIAWDASLHATRAVAAAMPLFSDSSDIQVFTAKEGSKGSDFQGTSLVRHLRFHGLVAGIAERHEADVAQAILREVEGFRASLVVMGGYGHSRFREFVFGGATRLMLSKMPVPVLMAH